MCINVVLLLIPHAPHRGTSPDRKVFDQSTAIMFGLLEIKCPKVKSFIECKYLKEVSESYRLKHNHSYYYQIRVQMGITGMPRCDFYLSTESDYHLCNSRPICPSLGLAACTSRTKHFPVCHRSCGGTGAYQLGVSTSINLGTGPARRQQAEL